MPHPTDTFGWIDFSVDDVYGARVGKLEGVYVDHDRGTPTWILVKLGRFSESHALVPLQDAVAGLGHVWVPYEKDQIRRAPQIVAGAPLVQKREIALCAHYGVMSSRGSAIAGMAPTAVTSIISGRIETGLPAMTGS